MESKRNILFIINPISGTGKKKVIEKLLDEHLDKSNINYQIRYTEYAGHAAVIALEVVTNGSFDSVVAVGGDGSVNEVASGLINSGISMGVIPTGSGNGFARHLGIALKLEAAIEQINKGIVQTVDTGLVDDTNFVGVAGVGFDAYISKRFDEASTRGFWTYLKLTVSEYLKYKEREYKIDVDGNIMNTKALFVCFCNSCQWGNDVFIAPNASTKDGKLRLVIVKKMPLIAVPFFAFKLFTKKVSSSKYYSEKVVEHISIQQPEKLIHIDGEPIEFSNEFKVNVNPDSLTVIS